MAGGINAGPLDFSCSCGKLQGQLTAKGAASGLHVGCYCSDCRAVEIHMHRPDPAPDPVDLFLTTQDTLTITQGTQHIGLLRLSPRGTMRWYATCCDTHLFNTSANPKLAFLSIRATTLGAPERLGPFIAETNIPKPGGKTVNKGMARVMRKLVPQILIARLTGRWRQSPLFDTDSGEPVVAPVILSKEERATLYPDQRKTSG